MSMSIERQHDHSGAGRPLWRGPAGRAELSQRLSRPLDSRASNSGWAAVT